MHEVFAEWNKGDLDSYLIEITRDILAKKDDDGTPLVDKILDTAGQKGTGKWTVINSQDLGIPITLMAEAVYSRCVSALKDERVKAARSSRARARAQHRATPDEEGVHRGHPRARSTPRRSSATRRATCSCAPRPRNTSWNLNYGGIALMWRGGCIIRSRFLGKIKEAFDKNPKLTNLLLDDLLPRRDQEVRRRAGATSSPTAAKKGIPVPAFSTALAFYDGYRTRRPARQPAPGPARLLRRAHLRTLDKPRGEFFHTNWTGRGGTTSSSTYNA